MNPTSLPPGNIPVLEAMAQPDPRPPLALESRAAAVCRGLPEPNDLEAEEVLCNLNAPGLTKMPCVAGIVSPSVAADLEKWITEEGWAALGVGSFSSTN